MKKPDKTKFQDAKEEEGVVIGEYLEEKKLEREAQQRAIEQTWGYKWKHLELHSKIYAVAISLSLLLTICLAVVPPIFEPHPNTEVEEPTYKIFKSARNWELMEMKIENKGSDETAEVTLEIRLPDNLTFNFDDTTNTKCSRPPNYNYTEDRLLVYRWYYLLPHTSIEISFHLNHIGVEELTSIVNPEHIVISSKGEHSPRYEYPEST